MSNGNGIGLLEGVAVQVGVLVGGVYYVGHAAYLRHNGEDGRDGRRGTLIGCL